MLSWAQARLAELEAFLEAHQVTALIHERTIPFRLCLTGGVQAGSPRVVSFCFLVLPSMLR